MRGSFCCPSRPFHSAFTKSQPACANTPITTNIQPEGLFAITIKAPSTSDILENTVAVMIIGTLTLFHLPKKENLAATSMPIDDFWAI